MFAARRSGRERKGAVWSPGKTNRGKLEARDEAWHSRDVFRSCPGALPAGTAHISAAAGWGGVRTLKCVGVFCLFVFWRHCVVLKPVMHRVQAAVGFLILARIRAVVVLVLAVLPGRPVLGELGVKS